VSSAKLAHSADWHVREDLFDQLGPALVRMAQVCDAERVDLHIVAGDLFERKSTPEERMFLVRHLQLLADVSPLVIVRGNHDAHLDLDIFREVRSAHPIRFVDRPDVIEHGGISVACLPWPSRAFLAREKEIHSVDDINREGGRAVLELLRWLAARPVGGIFRVLAAHLNVAGARTSTGQTMVGREIEIGPHDLNELEFDYCALGHIHRHQDFDSPVVYAGSPVPQNFGETDPAGFVIAELDEAGVAWRHIDLGASRRHTLEIEVDIEGNMIGEDLPILNGEFVGRDGSAPIADGDFVKLRVTHPAGFKVDHDRFALYLLNINPRVRVTVEPVARPTSRVRCEEAAAAETLREKVEATLLSQGRIEEFDERGRAMLDALEKGEDFPLPEEPAREAMSCNS